jgi:OmpA-OmpF porin, OOP family
MKGPHLVSAMKRFVSIAAMTLPLAAVAQGTQGYSNNQRYSTSSGSPSDKSWLPFTHSGYWGFNLGAPDYEKNCAAGFSCKDPNVGGKIYLGGQFNQWLGAEIGYVNMGKLERNGGDTSAYGVNLSLVGTLPVNDVFSAFAKVGTTYGWTKTEGAVGPTGKADDFGLSYGAGVGFNLSPRIQLLAEWDRQSFKFVDQKADVDLYSVGLRFRF